MTETYDTLQDLYRAARRGEEPSLEDRRAVRAFVLSAAAAASLSTVTTSVAAAPFAAVAPAATVSAASASVVGTAAASVGAAKIAAWVLVGFALGSATSATSVVMSARSGNGSARPTEPQALASSLASSSAQSLRVGDTALDAQPSPVLPLPAEASAPHIEQREPDAGARSAQRSTRAADHEKARAAAPSGASLADETRALALVQHALNQGDANRALELLARDAIRFDSGSLREERAAARVLALCTAGRGAEARAAQRRFIEDYPRSALGQRVLATCSESSR